MHKLLTLILLSSITFAKAQVRTYLFVNNKQDTCVVNYKNNKDTAIFDITTFYKNQLLEKRIWKQKIKILKRGSNDKLNFSSIDSNDNNKAYYNTARKPDYFNLNYPYKNTKTEKLQRKQDYKKLIELENAFFRFDDVKFYCLACYSFKKVYHDAGFLTITYNTKFGPTKLELSNGAGEFRDIQDNKFVLLSINGTDVKSYVQRYCHK